MSFSPIAYTIPNYRDFKNYWLRAYEPGTTTPRVMALNGETQVVKVQLNADGFPSSAGGALVIPYIEGAYDLWAFPTEEDADNNNTTNAERLADNIVAGISPDSLVITPYTLAEATSLVGAVDGQIVYVTDRRLKFQYKTTGGVDNWNVYAAQNSLFLHALDIKSSLGDYKEYSQDLNYANPLSILSGSGAVVLVGDSITQGTGASGGYDNAYANLLMRSIFNHFDNGQDSDKGFRFETVMNFSSQNNHADISTTGTTVTGGAVDDRLQLTTGQSITITGREIVTADIYYDADISSGDITFELNGELVSTKSVSGSGIQNTFQTSINGGKYIKESDAVTITASTGTLIVTGLLTLRLSNLSPFAYVAGKSGWGFDEHAVQSRVDDLAAHVNSFRSSGPKLIIINLGTNNIYNPGKDKTPSDYITALDNLITKYRGAMAGTAFLISVPPKANETTWPAALGTYEEYLYKIIEYCDSNNHQIVRFDKSILSKDLYYADGLHPDNSGHSIMAQELCRVIGIPYNGYKPQFVNSTVVDNAEITYNDTWGAFASQSFTVKAAVSGNMLSLSGIAQPNGSVESLVGTLPLGYRPKARNCFVTARATTGTIDLSIGQDGTITISGVTPAWVSFDGINLVIDRV